MAVPPSLSRSSYTPPIAPIDFVSYYARAKNGQAQPQALLRIAYYNDTNDPARYIPPPRLPLYKSAVLDWL